MTIEEIIQTCRPILGMRTKNGDTRCFFEDEANKILYVFGPSAFIRQGFNDTAQTDLNVIEFEDGPYLQVGEEILSGKYAVSFGITYDHHIPLVSIMYDVSPVEKKKKKRKKKNK
jgi:hypothetical protein